MISQDVLSSTALYGKNTIKKNTPEIPQQLSKQPPKTLPKLYEQQSKTIPKILQQSPQTSSNNHQQIYLKKYQIPNIWSQIRYMFSIQYSMYMYM